ncbi:MAG: RNA polymerase sigma factor [Sedimentisphaerales bacterium]|nr:RNA polymerase sigma factor [Sedimentisphaerales bacterium]
MAKNLKFTEQNPDSAHPTYKRQTFDKKDGHLKDVQDSLAARLRDGDRQAAAEVVEMYYKQIYLYMRRLGHDRQLSEDLTQESFLNAWYHIAQLKETKALAGWLYRIAGNVSKLYWRRHKGKNTVSIEWIDTPEDRIIRTEAGHYEQLEQLRHAVAALPFRLREVIVLHYMQHLTISEAADAAGLREGTFKSRLNRALRLLRKQLP